MNTFSTRKLSQLLGLACAALLLSSCALDQESGGGKVAKFYDADSANLIIRYSSDNTIYRIKPEGHDGEFYRLFTRDMICAEAAQTTGPKDLAVVIIGYNHSLEIEHQIISGWVEALRNLHYHRVVFLRARDSQQVDRLHVISDVPLIATATVANP
jgi:hypothetical protein